VLGVNGDYDMHFSGILDGDVITGTAMIANQPQHSLAIDWKSTHSCESAHNDSGPQHKACSHGDSMRSRISVQIRRLPAELQARLNREVPQQRASDELVG
jgi:hypothetical protein